MASTLEMMVNLQSDRYGVLKLLLQNYIKDSQTRKTRVYFKKRLSQVDELRIAFLDTHAEIMRGLIDNYQFGWISGICLLREEYAIRLRRTLHGHLLYSRRGL